MQENENILPDTCNFRDVQPIMMNLPYPPIQVRKKNKDYANILSLTIAVPYRRCQRSHSISITKIVSPAEIATWQRPSLG